MDAIYILIPISIIIGLALVLLLIWGIKTKQFEDLRGEGERILFDD
jgi:cbb3-type cytochrome oxidase maturation protein